MHQFKNQVENNIDYTDNIPTDADPPDMNASYHDDRTVSDHDDRIVTDQTVRVDRITKGMHVFLL